MGDVVGGALDLVTSNLTKGSHVAAGIIAGTPAAMYGFMRGGENAEMSGAQLWGQVGGSLRGMASYGIKFGGTAYLGTSAIGIAKDLIKRM